MEAEAQEAAARWLAEALETGNALAPLPALHAPRSVADGMRIAARVLDRTGLVPCGVRLCPGGPRSKVVVGPMLEGRLIPAGAPVALSALRHPRATAAVVAVLAEDLPRRGGGLPALSALHPAIDLAATRFRDAPASAALMAADLGTLGQVVTGRRKAEIDLDTLHEVPVTLAPERRRPPGTVTDIASALEQAAEAARRLGGLPAGAVLVVAGLSPAIVPEAGTGLAAGLGPLGRVVAQFA